jgi:hypothetical protein
MLSISLPNNSGGSFPVKKKETFASKRKKTHVSSLNGVKKKTKKASYFDDVWSKNTPFELKQSY